MAEEGEAETLPGVEVEGQTWKIGMRRQENRYDCL